MATTQISDVIVPSIFTPYVQQVSAQKTAILQSGVAVRDAAIDGLLAGAGLTFHVPSWRDLDASSDNVSSDDPTVKSTAGKTSASAEVAVRLSRNASWSTMDIASALAGSDPAGAIADRVAAYWARRTQAAFIATVQGIFANNALATDAYHVQNDMVFDISGSSFTAGVTDFGGEALIDTLATMGDSADQLGTIVMHSVVFAKAKKKNLVDYIPDSQGIVNIPTYMGLRVIVDDMVPYVGGVAQTFVFGANAFRLGLGTPKVATEVKRDADAGNGAGMETLYSRTELAIHPVGYAYVGAPGVGGPSNAATSNNLANGSSWQRAFAERKQIKIAMLVTREA